MNAEKSIIGKCPHCSARYAVKEEHRAGFRHCKICGGSLRVGDIYTEHDITMVALLPDLDGESFTADGYTVTRGVLSSAEEVGDVIVIPEGTLAIGKGVFAGRTNIRRVVIPEGVRYIGENAFYGCEGIRELTLPNSLMTIADCAFAYCKRLSSITLPQGVRCIGNAIFHFCSNLTTLDMPMDMTYVGGAPYRFCKRLRRAVIPDCVYNPFIWYLGMDWFSELDALEEIVLGKRVLSCERIPPKGVQRLVFTQPEGWYTRRSPMDVPTPVAPKHLTDPRAAAQYFYKLRKQGLSLLRLDDGVDPHILEPELHS